MNSIISNQQQCHTLGSKNTFPVRQGASALKSLGRVALGLLVVASTTATPSAWAYYGVLVECTQPIYDLNKSKTKPVATGYGVGWGTTKVAATNEAKRKIRVAYNEFLLLKENQNKVFGTKGYTCKQKS
jgi:hypothetical protein